MTLLRTICQSLSDFEWLILLFFFPFILFLTPTSALILAVIPILWVIRWLGYGRLFPSTPINWSLYLLLLMAVVSLFATFDMENSLPMVGGLIFGVSFYYALAAFSGQSRRQLYVLLAIFVLAGAGVTFLGLVHPTFQARLSFFHYITDLIPAELTKFPGDLDGFNANRISGALLWVAPLTWVLAATRLAGDKETFPGWLSAVLTFALIVLALLMTLTLMFLFSRAAQVGFLAIMALLYGLLAWKHRWLFVVALIIVIAGGAFLSSSEEYRLRAQQFFLMISGETSGGDTAVESFSGRTEVWERAYEAVQDFPVAGMGMNNFQTVMLTYYPPTAFRDAVDITHAHNQFLIVGTDLGIPGIVAYAALTLGTAVMLWQSWRHTSHKSEKILAVGFAASLLAFELFGLFDGIGLGEKPAILFWFLMGLSGGLYRLIHNPTLPKSAILPK